MFFKCRRSKSAKINKLLATVKADEDEFIKAAMNNSVQKQSSEIRKAKKSLKQAEKRIAELDKLFTRLYEDNVLGRISDERFATMSTGFEIMNYELRIKNYFQNLNFICTSL